MTTTEQKQIVFIQNALPPLEDGTYTLAATLSVPGQDPGSFPATATFVVQGERFTIQATEIDSVFPPNLANGTFDGVCAHVVFNRCTLPWERALDTPSSPNAYPGSPWLAVLVSDDATAPAMQNVTAKDVVPLGTPIRVAGSPTIVGTGTLIDTTLSYGAALLGTLGYGETPDDPCTVIDVPIATFNQTVAAAADMQYLAHVREVDTTDGADSDATAEQHAVVVANRLPPSTGVARAFLVSLEGMADYLPAADGTQSAAIGSSITLVRLLVYRSWTFTTNDMDQTLEQLLDNLNTPAPPGEPAPITALRLPIGASAPAATRIAQAMANQATGTLGAGDGPVLMQNALLMGYVPLDHHLRHGGNTVSFYRGPLVPLAIPSTGPTYYSGPDAANAYNPYTGMFDVSYGAAWQLGQLLALQNAGMANQLYQWKRGVTLQQACAAEQALLTARLQGARLFDSVLGRRRDALLAGPPPLPDGVADWFGNLASLQGVPFNYLVPDERMLPPESIRFFYVDPNWVDALLDGAFSIGRASAVPTSLEAQHAPTIRRVSRARMGRRAANRRVAAPADPPTTITGVLIRSQAVSGWPNLRILGFSDAAATQTIAAIRVAPLSSDTTMCLFGGVVAAVYVREPPEQLHHGVDGTTGTYYTTLRSVNGGPGSIAAGKQYTSSTVTRITPCDPQGTHPRVCIPVRADGRTIQVSAAAAAIQARLTSDFSQTFPLGFTSAEFALELTKGVVEVEFTQ